MNRKRSFFLLLVILALSLSLTTALAQDAVSNKLTYTVPAQGEITDQKISDLWTLETASADRISVQVQRTSGNLIPMVSILDTNNQQVSTSYGADQTGAAALIDNYTLPTGGTYQILVQRKDDSSGVTTGQYTVTVTPDATADNNPNNTVVIGDVALDTPVAGEITGAHWYQRYSFNAQGADIIQVNAQRTAGTLYPEIEVLDANGSSLSTGYTSYTGDSAQIDRLELPGPGTYTVAVTRQSRFNGYTLGAYQLSVKMLGAGEDNPMMAMRMGDVTVDTAVQGEITAQWYQDWTLVTQAGDTLTLEVDRTDGTLAPEVVLLGGSGQEINHGYTDNTGASAIINRYQLNGPGTYTVRVTRASGKSGLTTGKYNLLVSLVGSGDGSPNLAQPTGVVEDGVAAEGTVTGARWADSWTYNGKKSIVLDVTVTRTSDTLIPRVDIRDINGQVITSGYYDASQEKAEITGYALPADGQYLIVVFRDGEQNGYTTGNYTLTVKPTGS